MKIVTSSGQLTFDSGSIDAPVTKPVFLASDLGGFAKLALANQGWENFDFKPEPGIDATAMFKDERLECVCFAFQMPADKLEIAPPDREEKRKELHDAWLRDNLGKPPYHYDWGQVVSEFDPKAWSSEILVIYTGPLSLWGRIKRRLRYISDRLQEID